MAAGVVTACLATPAQADFSPNTMPNLEVSRASGSIQIDGVLEDPGWRSASEAANFAEINPGDQTEPPVKTRVWITYDESNLYLAFLADDDPGAVRASLRDRDQIWNDDFVGILLDTYGNASWSYEILANPLGVQGDLRMSASSGEDESFDVLYYADGKITEGGYQVEMAIPFRSLRFPNGAEQVWRAQFLRVHPRDSRRQYGWSSVDRDNPCSMCQFGTLKGIRDVRPSGKLEFLPALTGKQAGALVDPGDPNSSFENGALDADLELGTRYDFTSSSSGEITLNPDFSQVESDPGQIDVNTTFALFFEERRPFFQEGSDLYDTWIDAVYTRTVNDPSVAAKLTGRMRQSNLGYFTAVDETSPAVIPLEERSEVLPDVGESYSNVGRYRHDLGNNSHLGVLGTNRILDVGGSNTVCGGDGQLRFLRNYQIETQWLASYTDEPDAPWLTADVDSTFADGELTEARFAGGEHSVAYDGENFWGRAGYFSLERHARSWQFDVDYWETSPTFRADNGFVVQNDNRRTNGWTGYSYQPDTKWFDEIFPNVRAGRIWNFGGVRKDEWVRPELFVQFKSQTNFWVAPLWSEELFRGIDFKGIRRWGTGGNTRFSEKVQGGYYTEWGTFIARGLDTPVLGDGVKYGIWGTLKPLTRLVIDLNYDSSRLDHPDGAEIFDGYILRSRINYQFTRELFLRLVVQYDDFDKAYEVDPLLTYRINPFTVFFVGSTHAIREIGDGSPGREPQYEQTERQFFMKLQYLFRL